jgi:mono/diheme cytochrome c family protein
MLRSAARIGLRCAAFCALFAFAPTTTAPASAASDTSAAEELVYWLQYVGSDYGVAVRDGKMVDAVEYGEMVDLTERIVERYGQVRPGGSARRDLSRLGELIGHKAPWDEVRSLCRELAPRMIDDLGLEPYPAETPDLERGRAVYRDNCAPCHGAAGGGDGPSSRGMSPRPTSFRDPQTTLLSPHQIWNAANFGLPGTGMPAYRGALSPRELWDVSFLAMTMRDGFEPNPPVEIVPLSIKQLAAQSDEELLKTLRVSRPKAAPAELDYYRGQLLRPKAPDERDTPAVGDSSLKDAQSLERVFAGVADKVFPSVVGISVYAKVDGKAASESTARRLARGRLRRSRVSGLSPREVGDRIRRQRRRLCPDRSGPFVGPNSTRGDRRHRRRADRQRAIAARGLVGVEPTIDLAVLWAASPVKVPPVTIGDSDSVRVGQWAIAVGDPPGPERTFAPGTISAGPRAVLPGESDEHPAPVLGGDRAFRLRRASREHSRRDRRVTTPSPGASTAPLSGGSRPVNALPINLAMTIYDALKVKESARFAVDRDLGARADGGSSQTAPFPVCSPGSTSTMFFAPVSASRNDIVWATS